MLASRSAVLRGTAPSPFLAYLRLEVRRLLRNRRYLVMTVGFPLVIYVLYTAILPTTDTRPIDGLAWPVYFLVSMAAYGATGAAMSQAVPIATERRQGWARQLRVTPLSGGAYVAAKLLSAVALTVPALALVIGVGGLLNGLGLGIGPSLALIITIALASAPFAALGLLIGQLFDAESAQGGMVLTLFVMAILGGLFAPAQSLPPTVATIGAMLPSSHLAAVGRAVAGGRLPDVADAVVLVAWTAIVATLGVWRYVRAEHATRA
ncbi:MAG TPA: ABC transporter permease [Candidatus Acidoferrum sp.]|nr:ABC transporter permease [Candidatus Acidoferrum sp.]